MFEWKKEMVFSRTSVALQYPPFIHICFEDVIGHPFPSSQRLDD